MHISKAAPHKLKRCRGKRERGRTDGMLSWKPWQMLTSGEGENVTIHLEPLLFGDYESETKLT